MQNNKGEKCPLCGTSGGTSIMSNFTPGTYTNCLQSHR